MREPKRARRSRRSGPDGAEALFLRGCRHFEARDWSRAEASFRGALREAPDLAEAHCNLGAALEQQGAAAEAEACYRRSLELDPGSLRPHLNLGVLLVNGKRFQEALAIYGQALGRFPAAPALWSNLGVLHTCEGRFRAAEDCFGRALAEDPAHAPARYNLSYLLLREGRLEEGWPALEARPWSLALTATIQGPRWQGEPLEGRSLLIGSEGGHGDMLQFCRYAALLKERGVARIGIICHPDLKRLLATLPGVDDVVGLGEPIPDSGWDYWTLPLSLPGHCGTRLDSIPAAIPYLRADAKEILGWRDRLPADGLRVGLAWRGNPRFENDADRSLPGLACLLPLAATAGVHLISLQKGVGEAEAEQPPPGMALLNPAAALGDFADAAALVACLDLVITVDTAAAHLAGALGIPCWVLLPRYKTDWRWFTAREDSPWYPGRMRLFRQPETGGWTPVIAEAAAALRRLARTGRSG